jgi:hopanoid biosynthesis associated protein HpnK
MFVVRTGPGAVGKSLIVTADDFGLAREVNEAVEIAHVDGILTAASLMVGAPATDDAVARARRLPTLRVGLHLVLVDGAPLLPPDQVPDLVDARGRFRDDMTRAGVAIFFRPLVRRQLAAEIDAQFAAFAATGLVLDHVNAHKHFHLHPTIARHIVAIGRRYGLRAMRVPDEPSALLARVDPATRVSPPLWPVTALLRRRLRRAGLQAPDRVFGLAWSGAMTAPRVAALLHHLPDGVTELYTHLATADRFVGSAPGYRYADELAALTDAGTRAALADSRARLIAFSDLSPA